MIQQHPHLSQLARLIEHVIETDMRGEISGEIDAHSAVSILAHALAVELELVEFADDPAEPMDANENARQRGNSGGAGNDTENAAYRVGDEHA